MTKARDLADLISNSSVDTSEITDSAITTNKLADDAVTAAKLKDTDSFTVAGLTSTGNVSFGDSDKAIFGAGSDLQIYHDGAHSYLYETGTGEFRIKTNGNNIQFLDSSNNYLLRATVGEDVGLYFNTAQKLATTSTGISVTGDATFADNGKAIFGAGSDLQIYHDGANSYIQNVTNSLIIQNDSDDKQVIIKSDNGSGGVADYFRANGITGEALLYHYGSSKLTTTSTGVDVTGTLTSDGLTVEDAGTIQLTKNTAAYQDSLGILEFHDEDGTASADAGKLQLQAFRGADKDSPDFKLIGSDSTGVLRDRLQVEGNGDISFYEDTGTTPKFFWDASAERLSIGTNISTETPLTVYKTTPVGGYATALFRNSAASGEGNGILVDVQNTPHSYIADFRIGNSSKVRINSSGNVGIGTSSPSDPLHVNGTAKFDNYIHFGGSISTPSTAAAIYRPADNQLAFSTANTEAMRINSSGRVGIGTTSPGRPLHVNNNGESFIRITSSDTGNSGIEFGDQSDSVQGAIFQNSTDNSLRFNGYNNSERMRIDSSGNVIVGGTSAQASDAATLMADGEVTAAGFYFSNNIGAAMNDTGIRRATTSTMVFDTASTERMRIDSSGNLLVGKTSSTGLVAGCELRENGMGLFTRSSANPMQVRRLTNNGDLIDFYKDTGKVGSIGSEGGDALYIQSGTTSGTGLLFTSNGTAIRPARNGVTVHDTLDLGSDTRSFKDLYLSGVANVAGVQTNQSTTGFGYVNFGDTDDSNIGQIGYDHTANYMRFQVNNQERMRIDSSGNLKLTGLSNGTLNFAGGNTSGGSKIQAFNDVGNANGYLAIEGYSKEYMRIDSSGDVMVGKTSSDNTTQGIKLDGSGYASFTIPNDYPIIANRLSSDGDIAVFRKDGTNVGSIGASPTSTGGSYMYLGNGDVGLAFRGYSDYILPWNPSTNSTRDAAINIGDSAYRFKDLYLSGGVVETTTTVSYASSIALSYDNGSIQTVTLTGNVTFTDSLADGEAVVLMLNGGASHTVTWTAVDKWVTSGGNVAPTLTANDTIVLWKIGTTVYAAYAGSYT